MNQRLIKYAAIGHTARVTNLLQNGARAHAKNNAALRISVEGWFIDTARKLLEYGADPNIRCDYENYKNQSLLAHGVINAHIEMIDALLKHGANVQINNNEALLWCAQYGRYENIERNMRLFYDAAEHPELNTNVKNLVDLIEDEYLKIMRVLLENGADVHTNDDEALRANIHTLSPKIVRVLLEYGANVHANNDEALRSSCANKRLENVKILLEHGANVHACDDEALRTSAKFSCTEIVQVLLEYGADVHACDDEALRISVKFSYAETVQVLLEYGANVHACDNEALRSSVKYPCVEIVQALLKHGANVRANNDEALRASYVYNPAIASQLAACYDYGCPIFDELLEDFVSSLEIKKVRISSHKVLHGSKRAETRPIYFHDQLCEQIINVTSTLLERGGNVHVGDDILLKFLKENFHKRDDVASIDGSGTVDHDLNFTRSCVTPSTIDLDDVNGVIDASADVANDADNICNADNHCSNFLQENFRKRSICIDIIDSDDDDDDDTDDDTNDADSADSADSVDSADSADRATDVSNGANVHDIHDANNARQNFLAKYFHDKASHTDANDMNDTDIAHLNLLKANFYERLADALLPHCSENDYQYFDPAYIARKIKPTKNSRTKFLY